MKRKLLVGISVTMFLVATLFIVFPAESQWLGTIKIGAVGPMPWIQGKGIAEGCKLAAKQINAAGGILDPPGPTKGWQIEVVTADDLRGMPDPTTATGTAAGMELVAAGVDYIVGGFRTEAVFGTREVAMDSAMANDKPIFFIAGAATNELIDCAGKAYGVPGANCGACVRCNYNRYRYMFRITPMNSTMLFYGEMYTLKYLMIRTLAPMFTGTPGACTKPLKVAVISEDLTWADGMHTNLINEGLWNAESYFNMSKILRGVAYNPGDPAGTFGVQIVAPSRVSPVATDVSSELSAAATAGAKVLLVTLSGPVGRTMAIQWSSYAPGAILTGIDVPGQEIPLHWEATAGKCETESFLATANTEPTLTPQITAFWYAYLAEYGHAPIYTSYGAYDCVIGIKETITAANKWPMGAKELVPLTEKTFRLSGSLPGGTAMMGTFRFTQYHPMLTTTYDDFIANGTHNYLQVNPTMMGTLHELYHTGLELTHIWYPPGVLYGNYWARGQFGQWQKNPITGEGRLETFYPMNMPYSKKFRIATRMYAAADADLVGALGYLDGYVSSYDLDLACYSWLSSPGDTKWNYYGLPTVPYGANMTFPGLISDQDSNSLINIADISVVAKMWGYNARALPGSTPWTTYGQWPLP